MIKNFTTLSIIYTYKVEPKSLSVILSIVKLISGKDIFLKAKNILLKACDKKINVI